MGYAETGNADEPNTGLGYRADSMFGSVNFIPAEALEKLTNIPLSKRDRILLAIAMTICGGVIVSLAAALIYISFLKNDPQYLVTALVTALLVSLGLVVIFVAGPVEKTRQVMKALTLPPPAPRDQSQVNVNVGADASQDAPPPPPIARDVKEVKRDVKVIGADVKDVKEQTKKDAATAVGAVVKQIKKEVVKAVKASRK